MANPEVTTSETRETGTAAAPAVRTAAGSRAVTYRPYLLAGLGWLVPGLGHALQRKFDRAAVFFVSVTTMAVLGVAMGAKLYGPPFLTSQGLFITVLHVLGFVGDLGAGLLFLLSWMRGFGQEYLARASGDYGTVFFLCAGLLNLLTVLDAYDIAVGKKE